jgi:hypothetical protein
MTTQPIRKLETPTRPPNAPQVYQLDKVPTWMKVLVGALCGAFVVLALWVWHLQDRITTNDAKWFVTAKEQAELKGRLDANE